MLHNLDSELPHLVVTPKHDLLFQIGLFGLSGPGNAKRQHPRGYQDGQAC
jgi:hypothetical protein